MAIKALEERPEADTQAAEASAAPETAPATGEGTTENPPQSDAAAATDGKSDTLAPVDPAKLETQENAALAAANPDKVENPGGDTGGANKEPRGPDAQAKEDRVRQTEMPVQPNGEPATSRSDEVVVGQKVSEMKTLVDPGAVRELSEGTLFLAKFIHDPQGDTMWHVKQIMKDLLSGRVIRHNLSPAYWELSAHRRPPVCKKLQGTAYEVME